MSDNEPSAPMSPKVQQAFIDLQQWIKDNPKQTAVYVGSGLIFIAPGIVTTPAFAALGLGAGGPIPATAAPAIMSWLKVVQAGSLYATAQSAAMGGYGAGAIAVATQAGAVGTSAVVAYRTWKKQKRREGSKL